MIKLIFLTIIVTLTSGQNISTPDQSRNYVVQLKFFLNQDKIPGIITHLINNTADENNIRVQDIIELTRLDKYTLANASKLADFYNISEPFSIDSLEHILTSINFSYQQFQNSLKAILGVNDTTIIQSVAQLGVREVDYLLALLSDSGEIYEVLKTGIYDEEHVNKALEILGKTLDQVFEGAKTVLFDELYKFNSSYFVNLLREHGYNIRTSKTLWKALNITAEDVYRVDIFKNILQNLTESLNNNSLIATVTDINKLVIHQDLHRELTIYSDGGSVFIEANGLQVSPRIVQKVGHKILELSFNPTLNNANYIEILDSYVNISTENCTYVTYSQNNEIITDTVKIAEDGKSFRKHNETLYNVGSPVICAERLYGLAGSQSEDEIYIDHFYTYTSEGGVIDGDGDDISGCNRVGPSSLLPYFLTIFFMYLTLGC